MGEFSLFNGNPDVNSYDSGMIMVFEGEYYFQFSCKKNIEGLLGGISEDNGLTYPRLPSPDDSR
jgi:hypothetical protein